MAKSKVTKAKTKTKTAKAGPVQKAAPAKPWLQPVHYRVTDFKKIGSSVHANLPRYRKTG